MTSYFGALAGSAADMATMLRLASPGSPAAAYARFELDQQRMVEQPGWSGQDVADDQISVLVRPRVVVLTRDSGTGTVASHLVDFTFDPAGRITGWTRAGQGRLSRLAAEVSSTVRAQGVSITLTTLKRTSCGGFAVMLTVRNATAHEVAVDDPSYAPPGAAVLDLPPGRSLWTVPAGRSVYARLSVYDPVRLGGLLTVNLTVAGRPAAYPFRLPMP